MTREEIENSKAYQVSKAALEYYNKHHQENDIDLTDAFEAGAKWAYKTMIDKACEWLENNMYYHDCGNYDVITHSSDTIEEMIENFKKAMEK